MRTCEFCGADNIDAAKHCVQCNEPMTAADAADDVKTTETLHHKQAIKKEVVYGAIAVALVAGLVVAIVRNQHRKAIQTEVQHYYKEFLGIDDDYVPQFWKCMTRGDKQPKDNLELEQFLETAIVKSKGGYSKFTRAKCVLLISRAPAALVGVIAPPYLTESQEKYLAAVKQLRLDAEAYIDAIDNVERHMVDDEKLKKLAANYHAALAPSAETYAYDKFLRCAVPDFKAVKDDQGVLEYLSTALKDPVAHVARWRKDCYGFVTKPEGTVMDPDYTAKATALVPDDRDVQAFQDVLKGDVDKARRKVHEPFEKAWFAFSEARSNHMSKIGSYLAD